MALPVWKRIYLEKAIMYYVGISKSSAMITSGCAISFTLPFEFFNNYIKYFGKQTAFGKTDSGIIALQREVLELKEEIQMQRLKMESLQKESKVF